MGFRLSHPVDFAVHNEQVRRVWDAYRAGLPCRVPVSVSGSITNLICNPELNRAGWTFRQFFENPQVQIDAQLAYRRWCRFNLLADHEMGPPDSYQVAVDFQNSYDAGWLGCPLVYPGDHCPPDTEPLLRGRKEALRDLAPPDPLRGGLLGRAMEFFDYMQDACPRTEFEGRPVLPPDRIPGEGTDGPFTLAYKLRGAAEVCIDLIEDPDYLHELLEFVTENLIRRMKALRLWRWERNPNAPDAGRFQSSWWFADDAIVLLSVDQYRRFVLPCHRRLAAEFSDGSPISVHLCGDAARFFPVLRDELNARSFDTGFPMPFDRVRRELGPDVEVRGGPSIALLRSGPPAAIRREVARICGSGIMDGGRFVMIAANNLAPCTPVEHVEAMYRACREFGVYR